MDIETIQDQSVSRIQIELWRQRVLQTNSQELLVLAQTLDCLDDLLKKLDRSLEWKTIDKAKYKKRKDAIKVVKEFCEIRVDSLRREYF